MTPSGHAGAVFVLPTSPEAQLGPVAGWISTSGWAAAAERVLGRAWVVTPHGVLDVEAVRARAARTSAATEPAQQSRSRSALRAMPLPITTALKDLREWLRARRFRVDAFGPWSSDIAHLEFVWQRHEVFHTSGVKLARQLEVPSVLFVPALHVWQAEQWSVTRPGWGSWLERHGERPAVRAATVVACGTDIVAEQVLRLGVDPERILITPTGVDLDRFTQATKGDQIRERLGLRGKFVVGWVGSFRPFHVLEQLVAAAPRRPGSVLLLVGDGPERPRIQQLVDAAGIDAVFTGTVSLAELPDHLAAMDVGVVMADSRSFHYSPLKVAEYLAAGLPVVAPDAAPLASRLERDANAVFYEPGDVDSLRAVLEELAPDEQRRARLHDGALATAPNWSWDEQVRRVRAALASTRK